MKTPESYEKAEIKKYLDSIGAWHFSPYMAGFGKSGVPDIVSCVPVIITPAMVGSTFGLFTSAEAKREGKEPTVLQARRLGELQYCGALATWGTAEKVIKEISEFLEP